MDSPQNISLKGNHTAIMQIHMDRNDAASVAQDLKEYAIILCNSLGYNTEEILAEMTRHDLDHLITTFKKHFNGYVELLDADSIIIQENSK